jgi:hypothetical protein
VIGQSIKKLKEIHTATHPARLKPEGEAKPKKKPRPKKLDPKKPEPGQ